MKKRKEVECECMDGKPCECEDCKCAEKKEGKKKFKAFAGIAAGLVAIGAAVAGIFISKKKREEKEDE